MKKLILSIIIFCSLGLLSWQLMSNSKKGGPSREWREYLGGPDRSHYSTLTQINAANASQLKVAWTYHTGDSGQMQCNPIIVDGMLYGMTASTQPFAVDAATGKEIWKRKADEAVMYNTSRGVAYWENGDDKRILFTNGPWLYAVNAKTGEAITSFGDNGKVSLKEGLGSSAKDKFVVSNTPGTIFKDLIIMPLRVGEGADAAIGNIQAFNVETGKLAWVFHTVPHPGEFGYETWENKAAYKNTNIGGANNWAGMAIDRERGLLFVPTGSAAFDYYGGNRKGSGLFANCLLALDAQTGQRKWHYQLVHHDILDRDPPAPPNLVTVTQNGKKIDAVAQVTKQGMVFVFDRETGVPLFPIEERKTPSSDVAGEKAWPTQPFPAKPVPYARQTLTRNELSPYADNKKELLEKFDKSRSEGPFTPLTERGTIVFPGLDGGAEWGGAASDPDGVLYVNSSEMAWLLSVGPTNATDKKPGAAGKGLSPGAKIYAANCAVCHGSERKGNAANGFPSLVDISNRRSASYVRNVVTNGKGMMPSFARLSADDRNRVVSFLLGTEQKASTSLAKVTRGREPGLNQGKQGPYVAYKITGFSKFLDSAGLPAIAPPWGTLNAIDLNTGEYRWKIPFGEYPELKAKGVPPTGAESYGGPVITASGLLFIAGTKDRKFRVYDKRNGALLWETELPAAGFATPSTYEVNGRQYVVIACGGNKLGAPSGDSYVAFALPPEVAGKAQ